MTDFENPQAGAIKWLFEMELIQNPHVLNTLIMNIAAAIKGIRDIQFVVDSNRKKILIFLELTKWANWFYKDKIYGQVIEIFDESMPSFEKRVTFDREILSKAIKMLNDM